jgi:hypothetical protein
MLTDMLHDALEINEDDSTSSDDYEDAVDEQSATSSKHDEWHAPRVNVTSTDKMPVNTASNPPIAEPPPSMEPDSGLQQWASDVCISIMDNETSHNHNDNTNLVKPTISNLVFDNEIECNLTKYDIDSSTDSISMKLTMSNDTESDLCDTDVTDETTVSAPTFNTTPFNLIDSGDSDPIINSLGITQLSMTNTGNLI